MLSIDTSDSDIHVLTCHRQFPFRYYIHPQTFQLSRVNTPTPNNLINIIIQWMFCNSPYFSKVREHFQWTNSDGAAPHDPVTHIRAFCIQSLASSLYAIGGRSSLPLRCHGCRFTRNHCACAPMLYISELCEDCTVSNESDYAWTSKPWQRTRGHGQWRHILQQRISRVHLQCVVCFHRIEIYNHHGSD